MAKSGRYWDEMFQGLRAYEEDQLNKQKAAQQNKYYDILSRKAMQEEQQMKFKQKEQIEKAKREEVSNKLWKEYINKLNTLELKSQEENDKRDRLKKAALKLDKTNIPSYIKVAITNQAEQMEKTGLNLEEEQKKLLDQYLMKTQPLEYYKAKAKEKPDKTELDAINLLAKEVGLKKTEQQAKKIEEAIKNISVSNLVRGATIAAAAGDKESVKKFSELLNQKLLVTPDADKAEVIDDLKKAKEQDDKGVMDKLFETIKNLGKNVFTKGFSSIKDMLSD